MSQQIIYYTGHGSFITFKKSILEYTEIYRPYGLYFSLNCDIMISICQKFIICIAPELYQRSCRNNNNNVGDGDGDATISTNKISVKF